jgi:hypothetical protein
VTLDSWDDISDQFRGGLLVGNGASLAVAPSFGYASLLDVVSGPTIEHPLTSDDRRLFEVANESDFEAVLSDLRKAADLAGAVGVDKEPFNETYDRVRNALIEGVHSVHPRHGELDSDRLESVQASLLHFDEVFTTNYDLLLYWALTSTPNMQDFRDFFWGAELDFDLADTWVAANKTIVHYLHGGLHLFQRPDGRTVKASGAPIDEWANYVPLLELTFDYEGARYPLFVSEGSSEDKLSAINSNGYLAFVYQRWVELIWKQGTSLTVFGHRLGIQDDHLLKPLRRRIAKAREKGWPLPDVAISLRPAPDDEIALSKNNYQLRTGHEGLVFYDATTHPLGG